MANIRVTTSNKTIETCRMPRSLQYGASNDISNRASRVTHNRGLFLVAFGGTIYNTKNPTKKLLPPLDFFSYGGRHKIKIVFFAPRHPDFTLRLD